MLVWILIIIGAILLDQISKLLVVEFLSREEPFVLLEGVFRFTYVENDGAAFGMLDDHRWVFMILSVVGIGAVLFYLLKFKPQSRLECISLSMIIGGGIGNMIDRIRLGFVIDFLDFYAFPKLWMWVFNIADAFVCVGGGLLVLYLVIEIFKESKKTKLEKSKSAIAEDIESSNDGEKEDGQA